MSARVHGDWLTASSTRAVIAALEAAGGRGCARFVGGCVRNALIDQTVDDIDIATILTPEATQAAVEAAGLRAVPTGITHGTVTAVSGKRPYEITTLRRDVSTDGRNATVAFTTDWGEDAGRRDFRLNALYADADGRVFDPTGEGVADALAGRVVFVGDPVTRIREDFLRILRFFRFFAWYGRGEPDAAALAACAAERDGMARLSAERVQKELLKLLAAPDPRMAMRAMAEAGVLAQILPQARLGQGFEVMAVHSAEPVLRLMTLLPDEAEVVGAIGARLRLPNALTHRLIDAARASADLTPDMSEAALRRALYRHGGQAVADRLTRMGAEQPGGVAAVEALRAIARDGPVPTLPVSGKDVTRLGVPAGPEVGRILKAFEEGWIADDFPDHGHRERLAALVSARRG